MINMTSKLQKRNEEEGPIKVSIVGAGQMGRSLVAQITNMTGMDPAVLINRHVDKAKKVFLDNGLIENQDFFEVMTVEEANKYLNEGKFVVSDNYDVATNSDTIECVVEATGVPEIGALVAVNGIESGKHVCLLNVETDVCIGHLLKKMADEKGVIYTGSAGDEPGAVIEMYDWAKALGFDVKVIGKGKNNEVDFTCTPETVVDVAKKKGASPRMICAFKDGTKTMVEMTAMANASGFKPDIPGAHGAASDVKGLADVLSLKEEGRGGVLNNYNVVEYINGVAPGVFIIVHPDKKDIFDIFTYLEMGEGPNFALYRPYHLTSLETPMTIAKAVIDHEPTIIPREGRVAETVTVAKKDLKPGDKLDGIGGYTVRGSFMSAEESDQLNALPLGLVDFKTEVIKDIKEGQVITYDDVTLNEDNLVVKLRKKQDEWLKNNSVT